MGVECGFECGDWRRGRGSINWAACDCARVGGAEDYHGAEGVQREHLRVAASRVSLLRCNYLSLSSISLVSEIVCKRALRLISLLIMWSSLVSVTSVNFEESIGKQEDSKALVTIDGEGVDWTSHSEEEEDYALMACNSSGSDTENSDLIPVKFHYTETLNFKVSEPVVNEYNVACHTKETPSFANQQVKTPREAVKNHFTHSKNPKVDKKELGLNRNSSQREIRPIWNNVQRVNNQNQFVPTAVLTRTGKIPVNTAIASGTKNVSTARHSFNRWAVLTSVAMKVNIVKPIVNRVRPTTIFHKTHSPFSRLFNKTTTLRTKFSKQKVNTTKVNAVSAIRGKRETAVKPSDYPHRALQNKGIVDSGCSRHMTRNKAYLAEYQDFNGGPVAFGGSKGYITCQRESSGEYSNARTPQTNGVDERKTSTLIEAAGHMLAISFLPNTFWAEVVRKGPTWAIDLDYLTDSMNYQPGILKKKMNLLKTTLYCQYGLLILQHSEILAQGWQMTPHKHPDLKTDEKPVDKEDQVFLDELERLKRQEKDANDAAEALGKEFA
ncbi:hypothetical protein Tco_1067391 [Tanacetum coccineum]|uniref:Retrovirus-related Pol polyprotein from transposon TNT 1-94-like beta-barrel domain-containing protein n=1 Tax=Tanacetum coccineum TaxID=301880 RepID=A0ABQ5HCR2_9ASTR